MKRMVGLCVLSLTAVGCSSGNPMFNGEDLTGWTEIGSSGAWSVDRGVIKCTGEKDGYAWLSSDEKYGDFILELEWRVHPEGNTGVFVRAPDREGRTSMKGFEIQCKDDRKDEDLTDVAGAVFSRVPALDKFSNPPGEWNHLRVTCKGRRVRIELNGHKCSSFDLDEVKAGTPESMANIPDEGYIGLQNHGQRAYFRNVRIEVLE